MGFNVGFRGHAQYLSVITVLPPSLTPSFFAPPLGYHILRAQRSLVRGFTNTKSFPDRLFTVVELTTRDSVKTTASDGDTNIKNVRLNHDYSPQSKDLVPSSIKPRPNGYVGTICTSIPHKSVFPRPVIVSMDFRRVLRQT